MLPSSSAFRRHLRAASCCSVFTCGSLGIFAAEAAPAEETTAIAQPATVAAAPDKGVDALATSTVYHGAPADIAAEMSPIG